MFNITVQGVHTCVYTYVIHLRNSLNIALSVLPVVEIIISTSKRHTYNRENEISAVAPNRSFTIDKLLIVNVPFSLHVL